MPRNIFNNTLYIKIQPDLITVKRVKDNQEISGSPIVAIDRKNMIVLSVGDEASIGQKNTNEIVYINGFSDPEHIIGNFDIAEAALRYMIQKSTGKKAIIRPIIIMHPMNKTEKDITQIEAKALVMAAQSAGAREAVVWIGRELTDKELKDLSFPKNEGSIIDNAFWWRKLVQ